MNYNYKSHFVSAAEDFPVRPWCQGQLLVNSMRGSVTGQMQEPEDDVTGVAAFKLAGLVVSILLEEAGLVCGAALWGRILTNETQEELSLRTWLSVVTHACYNMALSGFVTFVNLFTTRRQMIKAKFIVNEEAGLTMLLI